MDSSDDKFVYYATLPSLQDMASFQVALSIWHSYISRTKYEPKKRDSDDNLIMVFGLNINYVKESDELAKCLTLPRSVKETLVCYLTKVREEMRFWIYCFRNDFFSNSLKEFRLDEHLFEDPSRCVWMPNGEVDFVKSAQKMLSIDELSNEQRFAIMSIFCMEDEIKTISIDLFPEAFVQRVTFDFDPNLYYWICYLKLELHKIPTVGYSSIDAVMARSSKYIQGILYFFNRLSAEDRLPIVRLYSSYPSFTDLFMAVFIQKLISGLSLNQQRQLLSETPQRLIMSLSCFKESCQSALWVWKHSKDVMTVQQFAEMVMQVLQIGTPAEKKVLLLEIWDTALDHHRNYVAQYTPFVSFLELMSTSSESSELSNFIYALNL